MTGACLKKADPIDVLSKEYVCGRSIPGIAGSNPAEDMAPRLLRLLRVVQTAPSATS